MNDETKTPETVKAAASVSGYPEALLDKMRAAFMVVFTVVLMCNNSGKLSGDIAAALWSGIIAAWATKVWVRSDNDRTEP